MTTNTPVVVDPEKDSHVEASKVEVSKAEPEARLLPAGAESSEVGDALPQNALNETAAANADIELV